MRELWANVKSLKAYSAALTYEIKTKIKPRHTIEWDELIDIPFLSNSLLNLMTRDRIDSCHVIYVIL